MAQAITVDTKKKTTGYQERCENKRADFVTRLKALDPGTVVYIDEAGVDNRLYREYARAPRGQKVMASIPGKKRERVSMIAGLKDGQLMAPFTFKGGCNRDVFNAWLEQVLLPDLPQGTTIILDNAAFHKSAVTQNLIQKSGCFLLFLPPYSPDLNPIEHCWHKIKSILRPLLQNAYDDLQSLIGHCLLTY